MHHNQREVPSPNLIVLYLQTIDFAVGPIAVSEDRQKYVDFAQPYWVDPNIILVQKPDLASSNIFLCFGPFDPLVWVCICASVIGTFCHMIHFHQY